MRLLVATLAICLTPALQASDLTSGLQVGDYPSVFNVADVTGPAAGEELCYRCRYANQPVVTIFTRSMGPEVQQLIKQGDTVVGRNRNNRMAAFVVLMSDKPHDEHESLRAAATKAGIKHTPLTIYPDSAGPTKYRINKEADVTVVMWVESDVKANHAMKVADVTAESIQKVISDTQKILP